MSSQFLNMHADYSSIDNDSAEKVDFLQYCLRNGLRLDMRFSCEVIPDPSTPFSLSLEDYQKLYPLGDSGSFNMNKTWLKVLIKQKKIPLDFLNWFFNSRYGFEDVFGDTCSEVAIPACWKGVNSFARVTKQCFKPLLTDTGVLLGKKSLKASAPLAAYVHNIWKARTIKVNNEARYHRLREERNSKNMYKKYKGRKLPVPSRSSLMLTKRSSFFTEIVSPNTYSDKQGPSTFHDPCKFTAMILDMVPKMEEAEELGIFLFELVGSFNECFPGKEIVLDGSSIGNSVTSYQKEIKILKDTIKVFQRYTSWKRKHRGSTPPTLAQLAFESLEKECAQAK